MQEAELNELIQDRVLAGVQSQPPAAQPQAPVAVEASESVPSAEQEYFGIIIGELQNIRQLLGGSDTALLVEQEQVDRILGELKTIRQVLGDSEAEASLGQNQVERIINELQSIRQLLEAGVSEAQNPVDRIIGELESIRHILQRSEDQAEVSIAHDQVALILGKLQNIWQILGDSEAGLTIDQDHVDRILAELQDSKDILAGLGSNAGDTTEQAQVDQVIETLQNIQDFVEGVKPEAGASEEEWLQSILGELKGILGLLGVSEPESELSDEPEPELSADEPAPSSADQERVALILEKIQNIQQLIEGAEPEAGTPEDRIIGELKDIRQILGEIEGDTVAQDQVDPIIEKLQNIYQLLEGLEPAVDKEQLDIIINELTAIRQVLGDSEAGAAEQVDLILGALQNISQALNATESPSDSSFTEVDRMDRIIEELQSIRQLLGDQSAGGTTVEQDRIDRILGELQDIRKLLGESGSEPVSTEDQTWADIILGELENIRQLLETPAGKSADSGTAQGQREIIIEKGDIRIRLPVNIGVSELKYILQILEGLIPESSGESVEDATL
jgi:hypothetical protein